MENNNITQQNTQGNSSEPSKNEEVQEKVLEKVSETVSLPKDRSRMIKIALIVAAVLVLAGLLFSFKGLFLAAVVDGHLISRYSVISELEDQGGKQALDSLIEKQLINSEAKEKNISVSDEEINNEIKKVEDQLSAGGQALDEALKAEGMTRDDFKKQLSIRIKIEKLIGDKANVSDEELQNYITESQVPLPAGQEDATKTQIREQMRQQKLGELYPELLKDLRSKAKIQTFVEYKGGSEPTE